MPTIAPRLLLAIPALPAFLLVFAAFAFSPVPAAPFVGIGAGLLVAVVTMVIVERRAPGVAIRSLGARPLEPGDDPRLDSLVESVCASHGITEPRLYLVDSRTPDAAVAGKPNDTRLIVTTGALRQLSRLELEAVVSRELAQFGSGVHAATVLTSVSPLTGPLAKMLRARVLDHSRMARTDLEGVRLTRYPPALAGAFEKAARAEGVPDKAASRHLWLIGPMGVADSAHPPLVERIDTLREL